MEASNDLMINQGADAFFDLAAAKKCFRPRLANSHKGTYGHALLIAGNHGKMGAAVIAAKACLRAGAGLLTVGIPENTAAIFHTVLPEAMVLDREQESINYPQYQSIGIGPGLGMDSFSINQVAAVVASVTKAIVFDADALNILSAHKDLLQLVPKNAILTPHPKEFDRLFGLFENDAQRREKALMLSKEFGWVIVLKGHQSFVAADGIGTLNTTGNTGLAKGGSGDCLTGIITALLAQGYEAAIATRLAVFLHGLAADLALENQSMESLLVTDVIESLGKAFKMLQP
ncbi:MAG: NAD(P)H-hydrate dehydratase [Bacteroidetes bacterium 24-39-8]|nr:MAG: NAD(P)H-hydrate dehydratase [Sphingobacteriia bacterium 35-40-8]OYZ52958.1 MAG: NAD(P)H-hydrate dehydratase [Bacteroidetes bacterium 24-39-8]OZA65813.1 MAG: NAD(P)H-hydrate dehydratase [Sphingobacteriia bacterium 39-39-8]HQR92240.1 NAD(P)H-hydrate dehydratase [Sediminibacterium sp.]HQS54284.1 NAD(P)H-hydrate dehydratase [Sediminibacterium sp.]